MIGANFESLVTSHHETSLAILFMFEQSNVASSTLLPSSFLPIEPEQLCPHFKGLFFRFLVSLRFNFLG